MHGVRDAAARAHDNFIKLIDSGCEHIFLLCSLTVTPAMHIHIYYQISYSIHLYEMLYEKHEKAIMYYAAIINRFGNESWSEKLCLILIISSIAHLHHPKII